jgi:hypothetical protein
MADIPIPAKKAHEALQNVLDRLALADKSKLKPKSPPGTTELSQTPDEWEKALQRAVAEIEEWCPSFDMVLPAKSA